MDLLSFSRLLSDLKVVKDCEDFNKILQVSVANGAVKIECATRHKNIKTIVCDVFTLSCTCNGKELGYLCHSFSSTDTLPFCHSEAFRDGYECTIINQNLIELYSTRKDFVLKIIFPWSEQHIQVEMLDVLGGAIYSFEDRNVGSQVIKSVLEASKQMWKARYLIDIDDDRQVWTLNTIRPSSEFLDMILAENPRFLDRFAHCLHTNRLYYADEESNVWKVVDASRLKCMIQSAIRLKMGIAERKRMKCISGDVLDLIVSKIGHDNFASKLDRKHNLLAFSDGKVFDGETFRAVEIDDLVSVHLSWSYNREQSEKYADMISNYFSQIFKTQRDKNVASIYLLQHLFGVSMNDIFDLKRGLMSKNHKLLSWYNSNSLLLALAFNFYILADLLKDCFGDYIKMTSFGLPKVVCGHERLIIVKDQRVWDSEAYLNLREMTNQKCGILTIFHMDIQTKLNSVFRDNMMVAQMSFNLEPKLAKLEDLRSAVFDYFRNLDFVEPFTEKLMYSDYDILKKWLLKRVKPGKNFVTMGRLYRLYRSDRGKIFEYAAFGHWTRKVLAEEGIEFKRFHTSLNVSNVFLNTDIVPL